MPNSRRHKKLITRIRLIEQNLLPAPKLAGNYTKKETDLIRSYVLLAHAEIESFFEDIAAIKVKQKLEKWRSDRTKSNCLLAVMSYCSSEINWERIGKDRKNKIDYRVNLVTSHYLDKLKNNHGIKSQNILNILLPLGVEVDDIDQGWLNTMDNFGRDRGVIAHSASSVQTQIDLVTEKNKINNSILLVIKDLDEAITKLN